MKPFNLELAKAGKPIVTRDGRDAQFIAHVPEAYMDERVVVLLGQTIELVSEDGMFHPTSGPSSIDLFMKEAHKEINGRRYPAPETKAPKHGQVYWIPNPTCGDGVSITCWNNDNLDKMYLYRGMIHLSEDNARSHFLAFVSNSSESVFNKDPK